MNGWRSKFYLLLISQCSRTYHCFLKCVAETFNRQERIGITYYGEHKSQSLCLEPPWLQETMGGKPKQFRTRKYCRSEFSSLTVHPAKCHTVQNSNSSWFSTVIVYWLLPAPPLLLFLFANALPPPPPPPPATFQPPTLPAHLVCCTQTSRTYKKLGYLPFSPSNISQFPSSQYAH